MKKIRHSSFLRYLVGGGVNTVFSYCVYWLVLQVARYEVAFSVSYIAGMVSGYFINALLVLKVPVTWRGIFRYPIAYLIPYFVGLGLIRVLVGRWGLDARLAPFAIMIVTVPLAYVLTRRAITPRRPVATAGD